MVEAATAVHREFGSSRRFSQRDKKQIAKLIATNMQASKDAWRNQVQKLTENLKQSQETNSKRDTTMRRLNSRLGLFLKHNRNQLADQTLDFRTTTQPLFGISLFEDMHINTETEDYMPVLKCRIDILLQRLSRLLLERETMLRDREACFRHLDTRDRQPLSEVLREKFEHLQKERATSEKSVKNLKFQLSALEEILKEKETALKVTKAELRRLQDQQKETSDHQGVAPMTLPVVKLPQAGNVV